MKQTTLTLPELTPEEMAEIRGGHYSSPTSYKKPSTPDNGPDDDDDPDISAFSSWYKGDPGLSGGGGSTPYKGPSSYYDDTSYRKPPKPKPPKDDETDPDPDPLDPDSLGRDLDAELGDGFCFVASLINQYIAAGYDISFDEALEIVEAGMRSDNGNPIIEKNGYVNNPQKLMEVIGEKLSLSLDDYLSIDSSDDLPFFTGDNLENYSDLSYSNGQSVLNQFREANDYGDVSGVIVKLQTHNGATHFVSVSGWDWDTMMDPHSGKDRSDYQIVSLRVIE